MSFWRLVPFVLFKLFWLLSCVIKMHGRARAWADLQTSHWRVNGKKALHHQSSKNANSTSSVVLNFYDLMRIEEHMFYWIFLCTAAAECKVIKIVIWLIAASQACRTSVWGGVLTYLLAKQSSNLNVISPFLSLLVSLHTFPPTYCIHFYLVFLSFNA